MKLFKFFVTLVFTVVLIGCGESTPSNSLLKTQYEALLLDGTQDQNYQWFEISNVKKIDGFLEGENVYYADMKHRVKFLKSHSQVSRYFKKEGGMFGGMMAAMLTMQYGEFQAGTEADVDRKIRLLKKESGWVIDSSYEG